MPDARRSTTPKSSNVLDDLRVLQDRVRERIQELEPFAQELAELRAQAERMGIDPAATPTTPTKASSGRATRGTRRPAASKPRRRRRSSNGQSRADQVLALVQQQPGISVTALGEALGVDSTGLYRVARNLEADGQIRKVGRQLQPVGGAAATDADEAASA